MTRPRYSRRKKSPISDGLSTGGIPALTRARLDPSERNRREQAARHGLTTDQLEALDSAGKCWGCGSTGPRVVDHDHEDAAADGHDPARGCERCVRGMLCDYCNTGLAKLQDDPDVLRSLADYVEEYRLRRSQREGMAG